MYKKIFLASICTAIFTGCSLSPKLTVSQIDPYDLGALGLNVNHNNSSISDKWWEEYGDKTLNSLVEEALNNNKDLEIAILNISLARSSLSIKEADRYPTLGVQGGASRTQTSEEAFSSQGRRSTFNDFSLSAILNYEIDLWGKISSANAAAKADLLASKATADGVRLSLASGVVDSYFVLLSLKEQLSLVKKTIQTRKESYELTKIRFEEGVERESTLTQQESLLATAKIKKNNIEQQIATTSSALGILLGRDVRRLLADKNIKIDKLPNDINVPTDIPSSILQNRPDIETSFQQLVSSNALIGVARAAYFPSLSLSALFGLDSYKADNLFKTSAKTWNAGSTLAAPLIDFGRTSNNVEIAKISKNIAVLNYEKTVLNAFSEVYNAVTSRMLLQENLKNSLDYEKAINRTLELANYQYEVGYVDYLLVLDAQRSLLDAQLSRIQTHQALLSSGVALFKALGGGWNKDKIYE
ncbi:MAG: efflux transporter outer membrane subunit [Campylobacteraceae bacterium]|jgi:multidrug efflux system outer membrane protein|nr:efflux transporter outer membrane subunit [Campylobacteraceae bacterium]